MMSGFSRRVWWVLLLASLLRTFDIASESLWVDEAWSEDASRGSLAHILETNARDTHPPLHSLGLAGWRAVFEPEGADPTTVAVVMRLYGVAWSLLGIFLAMRLARDLAGPRVALLTGVFLAASPIDIYFANEVRSYIQLAVLGLFAAWALHRWWEAVRRRPEAGLPYRWVACFALAGTAMIYTHYVGITLLVGQGLLALGVFGVRRHVPSLLGLAGAAAAVALLFAPWLVYVLGFRDTLERTASIDWMPVPGLSDFVSMIGREYFWGHAHKIHAEWGAITALVPLLVLTIALYRAGRAGRRRPESGVVFLAGCFVLPLLLAGAVSYLDQVIYYRPRYSVLLVPYFSIALAWACSALGPPRHAMVAAGLCLTLLASGILAQATTPQKRPWRETALDWPKAEPPAFYVVLPAEHQRPLRHYLDRSIRHTPQHVLERLAPLPEGALIWVANWPEPLAQKDARYRDWLKQVGAARRQVLGTHYTLTQVEPRGGDSWPDFAQGRFDAWYRPFDVRGAVAGFSHAAHFGPIRFDEAGRPFREAQARGWLRLDRARAGQQVVIHAPTLAEAPTVTLRLGRAVDPHRLVDRGTPFVRDEASGELRAEVPTGDAPLWIFWAAASAPARAWPLYWVGLEPARGNPVPDVAFHD